MADAVDNDDGVVGLPRGRVVQDRQKRAEPGAARQEPEILPRSETIDSQEPVAGFFHTNRVSGARTGQQIGELAAWNEHSEELEMFVVRGGGNRERSPDNVGGRVVEAESRVVSWREPESLRPAGAKGQQAVRPRTDRENGLGRMVRADGHRASERLGSRRLGAGGFRDCGQRAWLDQRIDDPAPRSIEDSGAARDQLSGSEFGSGAGPAHRYALGPGMGLEPS